MGPRPSRHGTRAHLADRLLHRSISTNMTSMPPAAQPPSLTPLGRGSVSLRIYPLDLPPRQLVTDIQIQARLAEEAGFDGCMFAEHHGGFPNYLPNPLLAAT